MYESVSTTIENEIYLNGEITADDIQIRNRYSIMILARLESKLVITNTTKRNGQCTLRNQREKIEPRQ